MRLQILNYSNLFGSLRSLIYYLCNLLRRPRLLKFVRNGGPPPFLCEELVVEILSRLPVKSLMRFRCLSKSWNSLISDSRFVKLHLHRSSSRVHADFFAHARLIMHAYIDRGPTYISSLTSLLESDSPTIVTPSSHIFIGACNGLIAFRKIEYGKAKDLYRVCFWNPATRLMSQLSPPFPCHGFIFGFGYDSSSDTYKVVNMNVLTDDTTVNVYNMSDNCWRRIKVLPLPGLVLIGLAYYASDTLNWLAALPMDTLYKMNGAELMDTDVYKIVSFDLGKQKYAQLSLPYSLQRGDGLLFPILQVLRGYLCISEHNCKTQNFTVWQMKEFGVNESWTQLFSINVSEKIIQWPCFAICISDDGDALLLSVSFGSYQGVLYTLRDNKLEATEIAYKIDRCYEEIYIESLVSPC